MQKHILLTSALLLAAQSAFAGLTGNSQPPLAGFTPYVVVTTSNKSGGPTDQLFASHTLHDSYAGSHFNKRDAQYNYTIGVFDTGAQVDILSYGDWESLGINSSLYSGAEIGLGGVSGAIYTPISMPMGVFTQGLQALSQNGNLDHNQLVGHGNTSSVLLNQTATGSGTFQIPSVIGQSLLSFYTTEINNSNRLNVTHLGKNYNTPTVNMHKKKHLHNPRFIQKKQNNTHLRRRRLSSTTRWRFIPRRLH